MTNRKWVTLHMLWKAVSSHFFLHPTASEWHFTFCEWQSHHIFSYEQQVVSDIAHIVTGCLIASFPMTNRLWVTLHILWRIVSSHLFLWPSGSEWHWTFCDWQSHHIFSYDQTACQWHHTFCERQSHHIFSYDQQVVSDIEHFVKGSLITSVPMTNSRWVTLDILWKVVSPYLSLWPTASEWNCKFVKGSLITSFPLTNSLWVVCKCLDIHS